jgi:hypothetical protein
MVAFSTLATTQFAILSSSYRLSVRSDLHLRGADGITQRDQRPIGRDFEIQMAGLRN